jgi:peptidyl-prolyl cis-trans isomerase C
MNKYTDMPVVQVVYAAPCPLLQYYRPQPSHNAIRSAIIDLTFANLFIYALLQYICCKGVISRPTMHGGMNMEKRKYFRLIVLIILFVGISWGFNYKKEEIKPVTKEGAQNSEALPSSETPMGKLWASFGVATANAANKQSVAIEVNGVKLTNAQVDTEMKKKLVFLKKRGMPAHRIEKMKPGMRKRILDDFVVRVLLSQEVKRLKIAATEQEVTKATEQFKAGLPPGATLDDLLKKNNISKDKFREEITLNVKINKLVLAQPQANIKPTESEIIKYYQANKDKFKTPETAHARHILVSKKPGDDDKTKADKKAKAELLRKQVTDGADFAEVAKKNSDCPSKDSGGDLGTFSRGQMVKPFEDAAFSQKINTIGPVVETDFGYHIIQVLERTEPKTISLDKNIRGEIGLFLQQQKRQEALAEVLKKLQAKATIIVPGQ